MTLSMTIWGRGGVMEVTGEGYYVRWIMVFDCGEGRGMLRGLLKGGGGP